MRLLRLTFSALSLHLSHLQSRVMYWDQKMAAPGISTLTASVSLVFLHNTWASQLIPALESHQVENVCQYFWWNALEKMRKLLSCRKKIFVFLLQYQTLTIVQSLLLNWKISYFTAPSNLPCNIGTGELAFQSSKLCLDSTLSRGNASGDYWVLSW